MKSLVLLSAWLAIAASGGEPPDSSLDRIRSFYLQQRYREASEAARTFLASSEAIERTSHSAEARLVLGVSLVVVGGKIEEAIRMLESARSYYVTSPLHRENLARSLCALGGARLADRAAAVKLFDEGLALWSSVTPTLDTAVCMESKGTLLWSSARRDGRVEDLLANAIRIRRELEPEGSPDIALSEAALAYVQRDTVREITILEDGVKAYSNERWQHTLPYARLQYRLGIRVGERGQSDRSEKLFLGALPAMTNSYGADASALVQLKLSLGALYLQSGALSRAEPHILRSLAVRKRDYGEASSGYAASLNLMGRLRFEQGNLKEAENYYIQALRSTEILRGRVHMDVARQHNNLGTVYAAMGDSNRAQREHLSALATSLKANGRADHLSAAALSNLGSLHIERGDLSTGHAYLSEAYAHMRKAVGDSDRRTFAVAGNVAIAKLRLGDVSSAEALLRDTLRSRKDALPGNDPERAALQVDFGDVMRSQGRWGDAIREYSQAIQILTETSARRLRTPAEVHRRLGLAYWGNRDPEKALEAFRTALRDDNADLSRNLCLRTDDQMRKYLDSTSPLLYALTSFAVERGPRAPEADRLLANALLQRKARSIEELRHLRMQVSRKDPEGWRAWQESQIFEANLPIESKNRPAARATLETAYAAVRDNPAFSGFAEDVTVDMAIRALKSSALLEFTSYRRMEPADMVGREERYAACIIAAKSVKCFDLGIASDFNDLVNRFLSVAEDPRRDFAAAARALGERMDVVLRELDSYDHVVIAGDDGLGQLPFGAIVDNSGKFWRDRLRITYASSGREFVRATLDTRPTPGPPQLVGAYRISPVKAGQRDRLPSLPFARAEMQSARLLWRLSPKAVLENEQVTQRALTDITRPNVLYILLHGTEDGLGVILGDGAAASMEDVRRWDLMGTEVTAMPICYSGAGATTRGHGVIGLRRSLEIAGTRSQLLAFWRVEDRVAAEYMKVFWLLLQKGTSRVSAAHEAQRRIKDKYTHPFYWASFYLSGNAEPIYELSSKK